MEPSPCPRILSLPFCATRSFHDLLSIAATRSPKHAPPDQNARLASPQSQSVHILWYGQDSRIYRPVEYSAVMAGLPPLVSVFSWHHLLTKCISTTSLRRL